MAKKEILETDEFDIDADLDYDDSSDLSLQAEEDPGVRSADRSPVARAFKVGAAGAITGAKNKATDPDFLNDVVRNTLPKQYGEIFTQYDETSKQVSQLYNDAAKIVRPGFVKTVKLIDRLVPQESVRTRKFLEKVKDFVGEEAQYSTPNKAQMEENTIASSMASIFQIQSEEQSRQRNEDQVKGRLQEQIDYERFKTEAEHLSSIDNNINKLASYNEKINQAFQRKSLELQYRGYFLQQEMLSTTRKFFSVFDSQNEAIIKNTALPEYAKITKFEAIKENARQKFSDQVTSGLFGNKDFIKKGLENVREAVVDKLKEFAYFFEEGLDQAEQLVAQNQGGGFDDDFDEDGKQKDKSAKSLEDIRSGSETVSGLLTEEGMRALGKKTSHWLNSSKKYIPQSIQTGGYKTASALNDLPGLFEDIKKSNKLKEDYEDGFFKEKAKEGARWFLDQFLKDDTATVLGQDVGITGLGAASKFDNKIYRSISEVIPGFLSRILQELQITRTGNEGQGLTEFNYLNGKFSSKKDVAESIKGRLKSASEAFRFSRKLSKTTDKLLQGQEFSQKTKEEVGEFLRDMSFKKQKFDPKLFLKSTRFENIPSTDKKLLEEFLNSKYSKETPEGAKQTYDFGSRMKEVQNSIADVRGQIELISKAGYDDILEELDLIKRGAGGRKTINLKSFKKLTMDDRSLQKAEQAEDLERIKNNQDPLEREHSWDREQSLFSSDRGVQNNPVVDRLDKILLELKQLNKTETEKTSDSGGEVLSDITAKENVSYFNPKKALANIKNIDIFKWKYKDGKGDGKEHVGPMAQDVNKVMGNKAAPGGKKIDLVTLNGNTMAAVEALRQQFEEFKNRSNVSKNEKTDLDPIVSVLSDKGIKISSVADQALDVFVNVGQTVRGWGNKSRPYLQEGFGKAKTAVISASEKVKSALPYVKEKAKGAALSTLDIGSSAISVLADLAQKATKGVLKGTLKTGEVASKFINTVRTPIKNAAKDTLSFGLDAVDYGARKIPGMVQAGYKRINSFLDKVKNPYTEAYRFLKDGAAGLFKGVFGGSDPRVYSTLIEIRDLLNWRLPGNPEDFSGESSTSSGFLSKAKNLAGRFFGNQTTKTTPVVEGSINPASQKAPSVLGDLFSFAKGWSNQSSQSEPNNDTAAKNTEGLDQGIHFEKPNGKITPKAIFDSLTEKVSKAASSVGLDSFKLPKKEILSKISQNTPTRIVDALPDKSVFKKTKAKISDGLDKVSERTKSFANLKEKLPSTSQATAFFADMKNKAIKTGSSFTNKPGSFASLNITQSLEDLINRANETARNVKMPAGLKLPAAFPAAKFTDLITKGKKQIDELKNKSAELTKNVDLEKVSNAVKTTAGKAVGVVGDGFDKIQNKVKQQTTLPQVPPQTNLSEVVEATPANEPSSSVENKPPSLFNKLSSMAGQFMEDLNAQPVSSESGGEKPATGLSRIAGILGEIRDILDVKLEGALGGGAKSNDTRTGNVHEQMKKLEMQQLDNKAKSEPQSASKALNYRGNGNTLNSISKIAKTAWNTKTDSLLSGSDGKRTNFGKFVDKYSSAAGGSSTFGNILKGYGEAKIKNSRIGQLAIFNKTSKDQSGEAKQNDVAAPPLAIAKNTKEVEDPRKIDTPEEVKEVVSNILNKQERKNDNKDPAFNDRDDDGDRDGNYTERLEELERRKKDREASRNNQAADNTPKYQSSEGILSKLLGGAKTIAGLGGGLLSMLGGAGSALGGLASLGGLLGGKGKGGPTPTIPGSIPGMGGPQTTVPGTQPSKLKVLASRGLKMGAGAGAAYGAFELAEQARANGNETLADSLSMVGNVAGAYTAFQGLSGLANMVAGTANKTTTLGKMVGAVGSVGSAASSLVGGTTGLVARAGLGLLAGVGGVLASPFVLIPAAAALTAYGGYKLYKYMKKSNLIPLEQYRFAQYGLSPENSDQISAVYALENYYAENALGYTSEKEAYLIEKNIDPKKIADIFGIGKDDKEAVSKLLHWHETRFKPIYLSHLTALIKLSPKTRLEDVRDLEPHLKEKYLKAVAYSEGPYDDVVSPFIDLRQLTATRSTVASVFATASKYVMDELGKENKPGVGKEQPKKLADFLSKPEDKKEETASADTSLWGETKNFASGLYSGVADPLRSTYGDKIGEVAGNTAKAAKEIGGGVVEGVVDPLQASAKDTGIDWTSGLTAGLGVLGVGQAVKGMFSKKTPEMAHPTPSTPSTNPTPHTPPKAKTKLGIIASRGTKLGLGVGAAYGLASMAEQARANGNETLADSLSMGANAAGAYSAFQGLSGVANLVAGTANKTTLLGKMVGAAGSVASAASSVVGGTAGLAGRAGLSLLGGMGGMLMSPVVLAPAAVGLALYGGYKAYKYYKKKNPSTLDKFRFSQYGFSESSTNKDQYYDSAQGLENYFNENALAYKDGQAYLMEKNIKPEEVLSIMGISPTDKEGQARALHWLTKRFKPIYLSHMTALAAISPKTRLEDINSLSPEQKEKYLKAVAFPDGPYNELIAPVANQGNLTADQNYVANYYQKAYTDVVGESGKKPTSAFTKIANAAKETATGAAWMGKETVEDSTKTVQKFAAADKSQMADKALKDTSDWAKDFSKTIAGGVVPVSLINFTKQIKRPDDAPPSALEMVRFKMYGLTDITALKVAAMRMMEAYVANVTTIDNSLKVKVTIDGIQLLREVGGTFRVHESDGEKSKKWLTWYFKRFLPIFTMYVGDGYRLVQKSDPIAIGTLMSNRQVYELAVKIASISESWNTQISPYVDEPANVDTSSVNGNLKYLEERAAFKLVDDKVSTKQELDPSQKSAGEKMELAVSENRPDVVSKSNIAVPKEQSPPSSASLPAVGGAVKPAIFSPSAEGEPKANLDKKPTEENNAKSTPAFTARIPNAGGAVKDGQGGMQYVKKEDSDVDLSGMHPAFMKNFLGMAQEYGEKTGKSILVTSAYRSEAKQAQLKRDDPSAASPGKSVHNKGLGMDISSVNANHLESLGLMRKYGFTRPIGQELWHIEPAGIQTKVELAKQDKDYAAKAISASLNLGGGGAALVKGIRKGGRSLEIAKASISAAEKQLPQEKAEDTVLANAGGNIKPSKFEPNQTEAPLKTPDQGAKPESGFMKALSTAAAVPAGLLGFRTASYSVPKDTGSATLVPSKDYGKPGNTTESAKASLGTSPSYSASETEPKKLDASEPKLKKASSKKELVKEQIAQASQEAGVNPIMMQTFAAKESSLDPNAIPPGSNARGVFQFMPKTWKRVTSQRGSVYGITENTPRTDVRASTIMAAEYAKINAKQISDIRPNPNATEVYLAHMLGGGGASKLLRADPNAEARAILPTADTEGNRSMFWDGQKPRTVAGYYNNTLAALKKAGADFGVRFEDKPMTGPKIAQTVKQEPTTPANFNGSYSGNTEPGSIPGTVRTKAKTSDVPAVLSGNTNDIRQSVEPKKEALSIGGGDSVKIMAAAGGVAAATVLASDLPKQVENTFPVEERSKPPLLVPQSEKPEVSISHTEKNVFARQDNREPTPLVESTQTLEPSNGTRDIRDSRQGYMTKHSEQVVVSKPSYRHYDSDNNDVVDVKTTVVPAIPGYSHPQRLVIDINVRLTNKVSEIVAEQIKSIDKLPKLQETAVKEKPPEQKPEVYEEDAIDKLLGTDEMRKKLEEQKEVPTQSESEVAKPDPLDELLKTIESKEVSDTLPEVAATPVSVPEQIVTTSLPPIGTEASIDEIIERTVNDKTSIELPPLADTLKEKSTEVSVDESLSDNEQFVYPDGFVKTDVIVTTVPDKTKLEGVHLPPLALSEIDKPKAYQEQTPTQKETPDKDLKEIIADKSGPLELIPNQVVDIVTNLFDKLKRASKQLVSPKEENNFNKVDIALEETSPVALTTKADKPTVVAKSNEVPAPQPEQKLVTPKKVNMLGGALDMPMAFGDPIVTSTAGLQKQPLDQVAGNNLASHTETVSIILNESLSVQRQMLTVLKNILEKEPVKVFEPKPVKPAEPAQQVPQVPAIKQASDTQEVTSPYADRPQSLGRPAVSLRRTTA